jgi:hypothetical protein
MAQKKLSHDQKRKIKLKKEAERSRKHESMAYHGKKYQTAEWVPIINRTEIGIYESWVISDYGFDDADVEAAIEQLILELRARALPNPSEPSEIPVYDNFLIPNIRRNWQDFAEKASLPAKDDLIGVLRTILSSLETRRSMALHPQGYLRFLDEFMKGIGVNVTKVLSDKTD